MLRVLLTNDDGVLAPGLRALAQQLGRWCMVTVMAPSKPRSATSHSITLHKPLRITAVEEDCPEYAGDNVSAFACSGTPSDSVTLAILHQLAATPPDLVISGINDGMNVAQDLTYSGTVGGALEGAVLGVQHCGKPGGSRQPAVCRGRRTADALVLPGRRLASGACAL
jgi:5'-nucleotidase